MIWLMAIQGRRLFDEVMWREYCMTGGNLGYGFFIDYIYLVTNELYFDALQNSTIRQMV